MTLIQVRDVAAVLDPNVPSYVSVFAGRIVDTAPDQVPLVKMLYKDAVEAGFQL